MRHVLTSLIVSFSALALTTSVGCDKEAPTATSSNEPIADDTAEVATEVTADAEGDAPVGNEDATAAQTSDGESPAATPAGSALKSIFSPSRAPRRKTMGLLQRSFLDIAAEGDQKLEVAIVVDGTDSMRTELAGVRQQINRMLTDLKRYRNNEVNAAIVVYRDAGSPSGESEILQPTFTNNEAAIEKAVQGLQPESGAPYFHELPDVGLFEAIENLPWSPDDHVTKWILLFGDAPPYAESRLGKESEEGKRYYSTNLLVVKAKKKGIRINCVLCTSSDEVAQPYNDAVQDTRNFMSQLSGETGGLMVDLSNPETLEAIVSAAKRPDVKTTQLTPITAIDLASVRRDSIDQDDGVKVKHVRVAVLPHMPLADMRASGIDANLKAVQVSTAIRTRLAQVAGVKVASPVDILRKLRAVSVSNPNQTLRALAGRLGADYMIWGNVAPDQPPGTKQVSYQTAAYRKRDGQQLFQVNLPGDADQGTWGHLFLTAASKDASDDVIGQLISRVDSNADLKKAIQSPLSSELLMALESLDQALEYETGDERSDKLLKDAHRASTDALAVNPRDPLAHWLQSNVAYNQAARLMQSDELEAGKKRKEEMISSLKLAYGNRKAILMPSLKDEILGDYALLVKGDVDLAIQQYELLITPDRPLQSQLRGHWMLSGLYAGDWGNAGGKTVDPIKARQHVMEIMANWPDSPQALLLKRWLKYDETSKRTEYNYLPIVNIEMSGS